MKKITFFLICSTVFIFGSAAQKLSTPAFSIKPHSLYRNTFTLYSAANDNTSLQHLGQTGHLHQTLINFNPSLYFDGSQMYASVVFDSLVHLEGLTVMTAYLTSKADALLGLWELRHNGLQMMSLNSRYLCFDKMKLKYTDSNFRCPVVNVSSHRFVSDTLGNNRTFFLAKSDSLFFTGSIGEVLLFNKPLTPFEKACWQTSLSLKYSSTMRKSNYISSAGDTLWYFPQDSSYFGGIAGVGFDTLTGLNQKQSAIYADAVTLSNGNEYINNESNPNGLGQGNYLIWGHNGKNLDFELYQNSGDTSRIYLLARNWRIRGHYSNSNAVINPLLSYEYPSYLNPQYLHLVITPTGSEPINPAESFFYTPDSITGTKVFFKNLPFNTSSATEFTIAYTGTIESGSKLKSANKGAMDNQMFGTESDNLDKINIYPNPTKGDYQLNIQLQEESPVTVTIVNVQGKKISESRHAGNTEYQLHGNIKTSGAYTVNIQYNKGMKSLGLIVK